ncbi:hypothetical protein GCM10022408_01180 [Hymenobacter fastidiosus]|uniref:Plasmid pRiA4b Orf3-like domain-containing protein n=1 Tax=Hymenobacter fastidiosus TaxID=486264 RepID=A0ABP7RBX1_9BACT
MANLLHLKVALRYITPPIWRRVEVPDTLTFWELHFVMQVLFDWQNCHLFEFRQGRGSINDFLSGSPPVAPGDEDDMPEWQRDPRKVSLNEILTAPKQKVTYVYDFGDNWEHEIVVEKVVPLAPGHPTPAVRCLTGRRAAPPEDIGSVPGYEMLVGLLAEKAAGTRKRLPSEYAGLGKFDPEEFDLPSFNHDLALLGEIVAEQDAMLAEYTRQLGGPVPDIRPAFDVEALLAALTATLPKLPPAPPKPKKPKP